MLINSLKASDSATPRERTAYVYDTRKRQLSRDFCLKGSKLPMNPLYYIRKKTGMHKQEKPKTKLNKSCLQPGKEANNIPYVIACKSLDSLNKAS